MQIAVNNVPLAPRIASGVSDQKEVISFFCGNDKFVVSIAKSFIYRIIEVWTSGPVSRFSMAAFTSSCANHGWEGVTRADRFVTMGACLSRRLERGLSYRSTRSLSDSGGLVTRLICLRSFRNAVWSIKWRWRKVRVCGGGNGSGEMLRCEKKGSDLKAVSLHEQLLDLSWSRLT